MTEGRRNIGREILRGIREIKRGEHGRVITTARRRSDKPRRDEAYDPVKRHSPRASR